MNNNHRPMSLDEQLAAFDHTGWSILCRRMQVLVINDRRDLACKLLNQFVCSRFKRNVRMEDHVAAFLPVRISEALEKYGYTTFRSIKYATDEELLLVDNFGEKTLIHLREVVRRIERGELVELPDDPSDVVFERRGK
jgi:hypothetical protein